MHDWRNPERVAPWKPRQKFQVTAAGHEAAARYRTVIDAAQRGSDQRGDLERAKKEWMGIYNLRDHDGILLEDMVGGHSTLTELKDTLNVMNLSVRDARGTLDRLIAARLVEPLEPPR